MNNIEELKKAALAATPGPWEKCDSYGPNENGTCVSAVERPDLMIASATGYYGRDGGIANAHFIALANPSAILDLIAQLEAAQKERDELLRGKENAMYKWGEAQNNYDSSKKNAAKLRTELLAAQKELFDFHNQEFQQRLANAEHQLYMKDLAIHNIKASRKAQFRKRLAAEAELSAANEKLSKPVVLPDYRCSPDMHTKQYYETIGFNLGLDACKAAIKAAGFTVEGE